MLLLITFVTMMALFTTAILLARRTPEQEKQMSARFAQIHVKAGTGLLPGAGKLLKDKGQDVSGWIGAYLARHSLGKNLERLLLQADSTMTPRSLLLAAGGLACSTCFVTYLFLPSFVLVLIAGLAASYLPVFVLNLRRSRRIAAFNKALPDLIETMARALRAGHALTAAISIIADQAPEPARTEFREVFRKQNFGLPMRDALMELLDRVPSQDLRVLVSAILVQKEAGGNLTQILDRTSAVIRERVRLQGDIRVHTAQGRMTGWILGLLPVVMGLIINVINPGYSKTLTQSTFGREILYIGATLLVVGAYLIRRIVNGIEI